MNDEDDIAAAEAALGLAAGSGDGDPAAADWERRLAALDPGGAVAPPPGLWRRIAATIADARASPGTQSRRGGPEGWEVIAPGLEKRLLHVDRAAGTQSYFLRVAAGAEIPRHAHAMDEHCVLLEGELEVGGARFGPGDFQLGLAGFDHAPIRAASPAMVFIHGEL